MPGMETINYIYFIDAQKLEMTVEYPLLYVQSPEL